MGSTSPAPRISIQPSPLQSGQREPSGSQPSLQLKHETSTSTLGSVNGKKCAAQAHVALVAEDRARELQQRALEVGRA